jgi:hypothetical protein
LLPALQSFRKSQSLEIPMNAPIALVVNKNLHGVPMNIPITRITLVLNHSVSIKQTRKNAGKVREKVIRKIAGNVRKQCVKESVFWYSV